MHKPKRKYLLLLLAAGLLPAVQPALGDDDGGWGWRGASAGVAPVNNATYKAECSACHFAYQPGLLPARSWRGIMSHLDKHFGDDASLAPETVKVITDYLVANAADVAGDRYGSRLMRGVGADQTPQRITELPYIRRKHSEIPARYISGNPKVGSLSNCAACHTAAAKGIYSEGSVVIPGYGRYED